MLRELTIRHFAIIDDLHLEFRPGLNVLSGETGAGKSIIIEGLNLILGGKGSSTLVQASHREALLEACFQLPSGAAGDGGEDWQGLADRLGIDLEERELVVKRLLSANGRSRFYLNGSLVPLQVVEGIGNRLVDFHGQHDHQTLLHPEQHLLLVDAFGGLTQERQRVGQRYRRLREVVQAHSRLVRSQEERRQRQELLCYQIGEIDEARLRVGEEEELEQVRVRLQHAERLAASCHHAYGLLYDEEGSVLAKLEEVRRALREVAQLDPSQLPSLQEHEEVVIRLRELSSLLRAYAERIECSPERLQQVEDRLALLQALRRKYGGSVAEVLEYRRRAEEELRGLGQHQEEVRELEGEKAALQESLAQAVIRLSEQRRQVACRLQAAVEKKFSALNLEGATLVVDQRQEEDEESFVQLAGRRVHLQGSGMDRLEFLFSANTGEPPRPLARIASGGELSRVMLALKYILAEVDHIPTLVFDEVDVGIGGRVAETVGRTLKAVAQRRQVFCITHLPQIAGFADAHYAVTKQRRGGRTTTLVQELTPKQRLEELARMSAGRVVTAATKRHARELLNGGR